jgi:hypothetical protein
MSDLLMPNGLTTLLVPKRCDPELGKGSKSGDKHRVRVPMGDTGIALRVSSFF